MDATRTNNETGSVDTEQQIFQKAFGEHLAVLRKKSGFTQEQLAHEVGLHRTYIGFIEQGKRNPTIGTMYRISKVLDIELRKFFPPA